jgi:acetyl-CoA carboxylase carboxyltransferase component
MGPGAAGTAYIPALADFVPMVRGTSNMALGGPPLVKAVVGEEITAEELGGSKIHCEIYGVGDLEVDDDRACIAAIKAYLSYFPANNTERPPVTACADPAERRDDELLTLVPDSPRRAYEVKKVVRAVVDRDSFFEIKPGWAKNIVVGLARLNGAPVGIVANQPMVLGGALDNDAADKSARFIMLCDAFNIPLVFFQDVPGFMVGSKVERAGIIRHGAKMLYEVSEAKVPKLNVVMRKAYGAVYFVMCGRGYEPDLIVAWPTAEISVMGPEGGTNIIFRKEIAGAANPEGRTRPPHRRLPQAHRPLRRGRRGAHRRRHRPSRDAADPHPCPVDGRHQAGRAPVEEARSHAGLVPLACRRGPARGRRRGRVGGAGVG